MGLIALLSAAACHPVSVGSAEPFTVPSRFWLISGADSDAVAAALGRVRASVAGSLGTVLEPGYPRRCVVTRPPDTTVPHRTACLENAEPSDGLLLGADGQFIQFEVLDFLNARMFMFEVFLVPDAGAVSRLRGEDLATLPRIAIPPFQLSAATYRDWLTAISRGIVAAGGVSF